MRRKRYNARSRIIIKFIVALIISFGIYGTYVTYNTYNNILENNYENVKLMVDVTVENMSQILSMIRSTTVALSGSDSVKNWIYDQEYFSENNKDGFLNKEKMVQEVQKILSDNNAWNFELFDFVTIYQNDQLLAYAYTKPQSTKKIINDTGSVYDKIKERDEYALILPPAVDNQTIYTTLRIQSDFQSEDSLYIIGATREEYFRNKLYNAVPYDGSIMFLINKEGVIYSTNEEEQLGNVLSEFKKPHIDRNGKIKVTYNNMDYLMIKKSINKDFSYVYLIPQLELVKQTIERMEPFICISLVIIAVLIIATIKESMRTTEFIGDFTNALERVRNKDYNTKMKKYNNPTVDELVDSFNSMTSEMKNLIQKTYESQILLNEMEIKFLQHQMNPHFLFNILLTIQIKAKMSGNEEIYRMISSLSTLLRAGIYADQRQIITIKEELKYVDYYLELQKERYEDRLIYSIDIEDDSILQCEIPRLIIEPMVENAIVHGVETMSEQACVSVSLYYENEEIVIHVVDNGVGFDVQALADNKNLNIGTEGVRRDKLGISNTDQRIKLMYGEEYGLKIQSQKNHGTDIEIRIPKRRLENTDDKGNGY